MKSQTQKVDQTHGNDFITEHIGPGYQQLYHSYRHFFGCQDPLIVPAPKQSCPNVKVVELFCWMGYVFKQAWVLGQECSVDVHTSCEMQGRSKYKYKTRWCGKFKTLNHSAYVYLCLIVCLLKSKISTLLRANTEAMQMR
eukprot:scaffold18824_cov77-Cyclotella_meneghiniana.AAC.11